MVGGSGPRMTLPTQLVLRVLAGAWELRRALVEAACTPDDAAARRAER